MVSTKSYGSTKRFGARYGRSLRQKLGVIEEEQRKKHKCVFCHATQVKRLAVGIWYCHKCKSKCTGKAYGISKKISFEETPKTENIAEQMGTSMESAVEGQDILDEKKEDE